MVKHLDIRLFLVMTVMWGGWKGDYQSNVLCSEAGNEIRGRCRAEIKGHRLGGKSNPSSSKWK